MNKHIELVKKWLNDNESVTRQELRDTCDAAYAAYVAVAYYYTADAAYNAAYDAAAYNTACAAYAAYDADYAGAVATVTDYVYYYDAAAYWVKSYEGLKEQGE